MEKRITPGKHLKKEDEPELLKAVNYALKENHHLDPIEYLCDVFHRIGTIAKEKLVDLLPHRWQPATVSAWV